jgi:hypothetical protein
MEGLSPSNLLLVDPWVHQDREDYVDDTNVSDEEMQCSFEKVKNWADGENRATVFRGLSVDAANEFLSQDKEKLFWVYIDAIHSYKACLEDLRAWSRCVADDGIILGHDYAGNCLATQNGFGVVQAVTEFCAESDWELLAITNEAFPTYVLTKDPSTRQGLMETMATTSTGIVNIENPSDFSITQEFIPALIDGDSDGDKASYLRGHGEDPISILNLSRVDTTVDCMDDIVITPLLSTTEDSRST